MVMVVSLDLEYKRKEEREEVTVCLWQLKMTQKNVMKETLFGVDEDFGGFKRGQFSFSVGRVQSNFPIFQFSNLPI